MNSLTGNFDWVLEISNPAVLELLQRLLKVAGQPFSPPFQISFPRVSERINQRFHVIVDEISLDFNADDTISLRFRYSSSCIGQATGLNGTFILTVPIGVQLNNSAASVSINFSHPSIDLTFSPQAQASIANAFPGENIAHLTELFADSIGSYFQGWGSQALPFNFTINAEENGAFVPSLTLVRLEVHCLPHLERSRQALAMYGILLQSRANMGDHLLKTQTALPPGQDVCLSVSPEAFHELILCQALQIMAGLENVPPEVARQFLPPSCGTGPGIYKEGILLTRLEDSFHNGFIEFDTSVYKSGFCYEVEGHIAAQLRIEVRNNTLVPSITLGKPSIEFSIPWYCHVASLITGGTLGLLLTGALDFAGDIVLELIAEYFLSGIDPSELSTSVSNPTSGSTFAISFASASISTHGLSLCGNFPELNLPAPQRSGIGLEGTVASLGREVVSTGQFHGAPCSFKVIMPGPYPYTEYQETFQASFRAVNPRLLGCALAYEWWLEVEQNRIDFPAASGNISFSIDARYPFPLPAGESVSRQVHLAYQLQDNSITLTNDPQDGMFTVWLNLRVADTGGRSVVRRRPLTFQGNYVVIGGGFGASAADCMETIINFARDDRLSAGINLTDRELSIPSSAAELINLITQVMKFDDHEENQQAKEQLMVVAQYLYGGQIGEAIHSPERINAWLDERRKV